MNAFALEWADEARRDLAALQADVRLRVVRKVERARSDPLRFFQRLKGETAWKLRVGDYRVIADLVVAERKVAVITVGHRRSVYR